MMEIVQMNPENRHWLDVTENRHLDSETLVVRLTHGGFALDFRPNKRAHWRQPQVDLAPRPAPEDLLDDARGAVFFAYEEGDKEHSVAGQVVLAPYLHRLAQVCDVRVALRRRRQGAGRALITAAERWAWRQGYVGLYFETQDENPGACQFILRCGFRLGGVDMLRYAGLPGRIGRPDGLCEAALGFYKFFT